MKRDSEKPKFPSETEAEVVVYNWNQNKIKPFFKAGMKKWIKC